MLVYFFNVVLYVLREEVVAVYDVKKANTVVFSLAFNVTLFKCKCKAEMALMCFQIHHILQRFSQTVFKSLKVGETTFK